MDLSIWRALKSAGEESWAVMPLKAGGMGGGGGGDGRRARPILEA